jgi:hypothetical protein
MDIMEGAAGVKASVFDFSFAPHGSHSYCLLRAPRKWGAGERPGGALCGIGSSHCYNVMSIFTGVEHTR